MRRILIMIFVIIGTFLVVNPFSQKTEFSRLTNFLDTWGVSLVGSEIFLIKNHQEKSLDGIKIFELNAGNDNQTVLVKRFTNLNTNFQKNYFSDKTTELNSLFETSPAPYPGALTRSIFCPTEFKPTINEKEDGATKSIIYVMYSNERFAYGICSTDLIKYRAIFSLVYCKDKNEIYQLEYFTPVEEFMQVDINYIANFSCG